MIIEILVAAILALESGCLGETLKTSILDNRKKSQILRLQVRHASELRAFLYGTQLVLDGIFVKSNAMFIKALSRALIGS